MKNRRDFLRNSALGMASLPFFENNLGQIKTEIVKRSKPIIYTEPRIKFAVIGMNHGHIYSQEEAVKK